MTPSINTYAYRAYTETLPSYSTDAKVTQLTSQLWHKDTATHMDVIEIVDGAAANEGFVAQRANIVRSRVVDLTGHLNVDLFLQDKFLINGVDVKIRLVRSKSAFAVREKLLSKAELKLAETIDICRSSEITGQLMASMSQHEQSHAVNGTSSSRSRDTGNDSW